MKMKRLVCALLCALIALSGLAFAEGDKDARIAELEAQVADLQAKVAEYHRQEIVAEFDGGEVSLSDAQAEYAYYEQMYAQYGISLADYGMEETIKQQIVTTLAEDAVVLAMAEKLGLSVDDATRASFEEEASQTYESTVKMYYEQYFAPSFDSEEEGMAAAVEYLTGVGYSYDQILTSHIESYLRDLVYQHATAGIAVDEADVQAAYEAHVADDQSGYEGNPSAYETARTGGTLITWNPEGYRAVKHILFKFDDDQSARYSDLIQKQDALKDEKVAAEATPAPTEAAETAEATEAAEATVAPREVSAIDADLKDVQAQIDALYEELTPEVEAARARFDDGEDIEALMAELNDDTGMPEGGYPVAADSTNWDPAFTEGAMSIAEVGGISEPVRGIYGVHLIYYLADIPSGAVSLEEIHDQVQAEALKEKTASAYTDQLAAWKEELNLKLYPENL